MSNILITGGGGYVGSLLTPYLIQKGHKVTVLDLFIYGEDVLQKNNNLKVVKGDIRNEDLISKITKNQDIVIHLACISNDPSFELNPNLGKSINLDAFRPLVEQSVSNNVKKFIYASSSSVYGIKKERDVNELMSLEPLTDYSKYKADCEKILLDYQSDKFIVTILRPATVCGYAPRQRLDVVVNILTNLAYHNREIKIFGGSQLRPNIHINDMVKSYEVIINAEDNKIDGQIFNVGYDNKSVKEIAKIVKSELGDDIKFLTEKTNDNRSYHISSHKIQKTLGFSPDFNINDAAKDLKIAFDEKKLKNPLNNEFYFNIKRMQSINLK